MRALIVDDDVDRGSLAAARDLAADGWFVGSASRTPSLPSASRAVHRWDELPSLADGEEPFVDRLRGILEDGAYDVVLTTWDSAVEIISRRREELPAVVPYGAHQGIATALDKLELNRIAESVGISIPRTVEATPEALEMVDGETIVKPAAHTPQRIRARICSGRVETREAVAAIRAVRATPLLQEPVAGSLEGLALVVGRDGEPVSLVSQVTDAVWPQPVGVTVRAHTVPVDDALLEQVLLLLRKLDWFGLVQLQFLRSPDGQRFLIDLNPRGYGSLALAIGAGARHPSQWARAALDLPLLKQQAAAGVYYQWLTRDLRAQVRVSGLREGIRSSIGLAPAAAHSIWSRDEPSFAVRYFARQLVSAARRGTGFDAKSA